MTLGSLIVVNWIHHIAIKFLGFYEKSPFLLSSGTNLTNWIMGRRMLDEYFS